MKKNIILLAYTLMYCIHLFSQTTEVNYYSNNPNLGGDAVINRSMVSVKENSAIISFEVDVPTAGEYYANFSLNGSAQVSLLILDLSGRTITTIVNNESLDSGNHTYQMPSITDDVYLVQLIIDGHVNVKKVYNSTFASRIYGDKGR